MKVWELSIWVNDYNQHGSYTMSLFKKKPSADKILSIKDSGYPMPFQRGLGIRESVEKLISEGTLDEFPNGGGDTWSLSEVEVQE